MKKTLTLFIFSLLLLGFTSGDDDIKTEYYFRLNKLKKAQSPQKMKMIMIDNLSSSKSIIVRGMLFTYKNREAGNVHISGSFSQWKKNKMSRNKNGIWYYFLKEYDGNRRIEYKFNVDGIWVMDPNNFDNMDDGSGSFVSVTETIKSSEGKQVTFRVVEKNLVEFRTYRPKARFISIVGDFNNWNPENDLLKKGTDGIWRLRKRISSGTYRYKFIIDGKWVSDLYNNNSGSDSTGDICSILEVK
ncbi:MAG: hypothetical protein GY754_11720 [bacterium]|nr:hypothetical protein [bacterium]